MQAANSIRTVVRRVLCLFTPAALSLVTVSPVFAGPEDGIVVRGTATIDRTAPGAINIDQLSDRAAINWRSFSIGTDESVNFNQPSSTAATLNRVVGGQRSVIEGALSANGQVYLLNPSGVLFGKSAKVDVGGLIATTSALGDDDFMAGKLNFNAAALPGAEVANLGSISISDGGLGALVAPTVRNEGLISARLGRLALAAGETYTVDPYGDQLINFALPDAPSDTTPHSVVQSGTMLADGGRVLLTTDAMAGVVGGVVNMSGVIQARTAGRTQSGEIVLSSDVTSVSGTIDVSADSEGNAGSVSIWGTDAAKFTGTVLARGGEQGGDGGFLELSGKGAVIFDGALHAQAANGLGGTLLIDPLDITIEATGSSNLVDPTISGATIRNLLRQGTTVQLIADNSITVNDILDGRPVGNQNQAGGGVDLRAGTILVLQPIITNNGAISLTATQGNLTFDSNAFVVVTSATSASGVGTAAVNLAAAQSVAAAGQIVSLGRVSVTASSGNVQLVQALNGLQTTNGPSGIGDLSVTAGGAISTAGALSNGAVSLDAGSTVSVNGAINAAGAISVSARSANGGITVTGAGAANVAGLNAGGNLTLATPGTVTLDNSILSQGGDIAIGSTTQRVAALGMNSAAAVQSVASTTAADQDGDIAVFVAGSLTTGDLIAGASGDVLIDTTGDATLSRGLFGLTGSTGIGSLTVNAGGTLTSNGARAARAIALTSTGALSNSNASLISDGGAISLTSSSITLNEIRSNGALISAIDAGGDIRLTTPGAVILSSNLLSRGGNVSIGSASQRAASIAMAAETSIGTAASSSATDQDGDIALFSAGALTTRDLLAGSSGDVLIDSQGAVTLSRGVFGLGAAGVGSLTVNAVGPLTANGAHTTGAIALNSNGGAIRNPTASLLADTGAISLSGNAITLDAITANGSPVAALDAGGDITMTTPGAVILNSGAISRGGNVQIGSSTQRVASLTMASGTSLQSVAGTIAADQDGDIAIFTTGAFSAQDLLAGTAGDVSVDTTGPVTLNRNLAGLANSTGLGSLTITTTSGAIAANGVRANGAIALTTTGTVSNSVAPLVSNTGAITLAGSAVTLNAISGSGVVNAGTDFTVASAGGVAIGGGVLAGGDIRIGSNAQQVASLTMAEGATLRSNAGAGAISVQSAGSIVTRDIVTGTSGSVVLSGTNVTVDGSINDATSTGVGQVAITGTSTVTVGGIRVSNALQPTTGATTELVRLITGPTNATVNINGPIVSGGRVRIGQVSDTYAAGSDDVRINLSNDISTSGQAVTLAGDVILFNEITRWDIECALTGICVPGHQREFDVALFDPLVVTNAVTNNGPSSDLALMNRYASLCTPGLCEVIPDPSPFATPGDSILVTKRSDQFYTLIQVNFVAYDFTGGSAQPLSATYNGNTYADCAGSYICGLPSGPISPTVDVALAAQRLDRMKRLLGGLTATIDTTTGGSAAGASVTFRGNVERYRGQVPASFFIAGATPILPSFVSHGLRVTAGSSGVITTIGQVGDRNLGAGFATPPNGSSIFSGADAMELGAFDVVFNGASYVPGSAPPSLTTFTVNGANQFLTTPGTVNSTFSYNWPFSTVGSGTFVGSDGANTSIGSGASFQVTPGGGGLSLFGSSGAGGTAIGGAGGSGSASAGSLTGLTGFGGLPEVTADTLRPGSTPETASASERRRDGLDAEVTLDDSQDQQADRCPRGPAQLADMGTRRAVEGSAPDVFARCEE
jgi:filamentous hemagglutinin family protein